MSSNFTQNLPRKFVQNVTGLCAEEGKRWLESLPQLVEELEFKWNVEFEEYFPNLSYNFVATCRDQEGEPRVLKIALPLRNPEIFREAKTLKEFANNGGAKVLDLDRERRALLIERLLPGKNLKELFKDNKDRAIDRAIEVLKRISQTSPEDTDLPLIANWFEAFEIAEATAFPKEPLHNARNLLEELNAESNEPTLLHGDFHHENILSAGKDEFRVIDPKGVIGNIGYEISVFLNNHLEWIENKQDVDNAVEKFSRAFEISPRTLKNWSYVQRVLAVCWGFEDGGSRNEKYLENAEIWIA